MENKKNKIRRQSDWFYPAGWNPLDAPCRIKNRATFSGNPAISAYLRPVAFRPHLAMGLALIWYSLIFSLFSKALPRKNSSKAKKKGEKIKSHFFLSPLDFILKHKLFFMSSNIFVGYH